MAVSNSPWKTYKLNHKFNKSFSFLLHFYDEKLTSIIFGLGPSYDGLEMDSQMNILRKKFKEFVNESNYKWGSVQFIEDRRNSSSEIYIKYSSDKLRA